MGSSNPTSGKGPPAKGKCPVCGAPTEADARPFCSPRCADVDLSRWLRGGYAIPVTADSDEDGEEGEVVEATRSRGIGQAGRGGGDDPNKGGRHDDADE